MSTLYKTRHGDSPGIIARRFRTSVGALIASNPHKPTTVVSGRRTWQGLGLGEQIWMPPGVGVGFVGDAAADSVNAVISAGGPCLQANASLVCAAQRALGVLADGEWGPGTSAAARQHVPSAPGGCSPTPMWWGAKGTNHCGGASAAPAPSSGGGGGGAPASTTSLVLAARTALTALSNDSNYCVSVGHTGSAVNSAVHNFKAAWNAANPSRAVPIGTGKYEVVVAAALWSALGGQVDVPPGCGAAGVPAPATQGPPPGAPPPAAPTQGPPPMPGPSGPVSPAPSAGSSAPAAVQALTSIDPCSQANAGFVCQAQSAMGLIADGKYGPGTAAAAQALGVAAPAACPPHTSWWGQKGSNQCPGAGGGAPSGGGGGAPSGGGGGAPAGGGGGAPAGGGGGVPIHQADPGGPGGAGGGGGGGGSGTNITPPEAKKPLSTGMIVAGAVGAAALVGLLAAAAMGGKKSTSTSRTTISRPARRKPSKKRKSSKRKKR